MGGMLLVADGMAVMPIKRRVGGPLAVGDASRRFRPATAPVMSKVPPRRRSLAALSEIADAGATGDPGRRLPLFCGAPFDVRRSPFVAGWRRVVDNARPRLFAPFPPTGASPLPTPMAAAPT